MTNATFRSLVCGAVVSLVAVIGLSGRAGAQVAQPATTTRQGDAANSRSPVLYRSTADTARMAWGRKHFERYATVDGCDRAAVSLRAEMSRTRMFDTIPYRLEADTVFTAVRELARACGGKATVEATDPRELWSLFRIALTLGNYDQANAVVVRQLALAKVATDSANVRVLALDGYLDASPPQLALAQAMLRDLDAMGTSQKIAQFRARVRLFDYWQTVYNVDSLRAYADAARKLALAMPQAERDEVEMEAPYEKLIQLANETADLSAQAAYVNEALKELEAWRGGRAYRWVNAMDDMITIRHSLYGKKTKPLAGKFWFNHQGTPKPVPGKASLIIHVDHTCGEPCFPIYTVLRQLMQRYGNDIDLIFLTETRGFAIGAGALEPEAEAKKAASYFLDFLKFPASVLVDETPFTPLPDGRRVAGRSTISTMFGGWQVVNTVLVDQEGAIQWIGALTSRQDERMITAAIEKVVRK